MWDKDRQTRRRAVNGVGVSTVDSLKAESNEAAIGQNELTHSNFVVFLSTSNTHRANTCDSNMHN